MLTRQPARTWDQASSPPSGGTNSVGLGLDGLAASSSRSVEDWSLFVAEPQRVAPFSGSILLVIVSWSRAKCLQG